MRTIEEIKADISENNKSQLANRFERSHALITEFLYAVTDEITLDRLQEICEAEKDGRCVVLPCKVGRKAVMVFDVSGELFITDGWVAENILITENETVYNFYCSITNEYERRNSDDFGKTIFLTREEAEQALKGALKNDTAR